MILHLEASLRQMKIIYSPWRADGTTQISLRSLSACKLTIQSRRRNKNSNNNKAIGSHGKNFNSLLSTNVDDSRDLTAHSPHPTSVGNRTNSIVIVIYDKMEMEEEERCPAPKAEFKQVEIYITCTLQPKRIKSIYITNKVRRKWKSVQT